MNLSVFTVILVLGLLMAPLAAEAPPAGKIYRIDYLLHAQDVQGSQDLEGAFARMAQARPEALLILGDSLITICTDPKSRRSPPSSICRACLSPGNGSWPAV